MTGQTYKCDGCNWVYQENGVIGMFPEDLMPSGWHLVFRQVDNVPGSWRQRAFHYCGKCAANGEIVVPEEPIKDAHIIDADAPEVPDTLKET